MELIIVLLAVLVAGLITAAVRLELAFSRENQIDNLLNYPSNFTRDGKLLSRTGEAAAARLGISNADLRD